MAEIDLSTPDPEAWTLHLDLPEGAAPTATALYYVAAGVAAEHGAKPQPMYWDADEKAWWSLSATSERPIDRLVWTVDLVQLSFHEADTHRPFLESVLAELSARAASIGAKIRPAISVSEALYKLPQVVQRHELRNAQIEIRVFAPEPAPVRAWWEALEKAGLHIGDGDMFWVDAESLGYPEEYFEICAEPKSSQGYFHPGDLDGKTTFPDVSLTFSIMEPEDPVAVLADLERLAEGLAGRLRGRISDAEGRPWARDAALDRIHEVRRALGMSID